MSSQVVEDRELVLSSGFYADLGIGELASHSAKSLNPLEKEKKRAGCIRYDHLYQ